MQLSQTVGIYLPLKALVWQDIAGDTWISYNQPEWIAQRHGITSTAQPITKMVDLLGTITQSSAGRPE